MIERRPIASRSSGNGTAATASLEQRIAAALRGDADAASSELQQLLAEVDTAIAAAVASVAEQRERALDPLSTTDSASAHSAVVIAELHRDRLRVARPRLEQRLAAAVAEESALRWDAHYRRLAAKVEEAAVRVARYPTLAAEIVELVQLAAAVDKEVGDLHIRAASGEHRRLPQVELLARNLPGFSISQPSIAQGLRLPDWEASEQTLWPRRERLDPSFFAPPPYDERFSADWYKRGEQERAAAAERERLQVLADDAARRAFYGQLPPEPAPLPETEATPPEAAPPTAE
jgi:hypothetical protein